MFDDIWGKNNFDEPWQPEVAKSLSKMNVEDCYTITAGSFGRNLLHPFNTSINGGEGGTLGKSGSIKVGNKLKVIEITFEVILDEAPAKIFIQFSHKGITKSQEVVIDTIPTVFGNKPRLVCDCGRAGKLYLRADCYGFMCRHCANITYEIMEYDRRSVGNIIPYYMNRAFKLEAMKARVTKVSYRGQYTRRALSVLKMARKWRMGDSVKAIIEAKFRPSSALQA